jgi:hypothetical protein
VLEEGTIVTATRGSWERLLNELREAGDIIEGVDADDATRADGYRAVLTMLSAQIEMQTENHPLHPRLTRVFTPTRRYFGDHPDAVYHYAPLAGDRQYRLHGFMGNPSYFAVTVYAGSSRPGQGRVAAHLHGSELNVEPDGRFSFTLGPKRDPEPDLVVPHDVFQLLIRQYYVGVERREATLEIECMDTDEPPGRPGDSEYSRRVDRLAKAVRYNGPRLGLRFMKAYEELAGRSKSGSRAASDDRPGEGEINTKAFDGGLWGTPDTQYYALPYRLGPGEALRVTGRTVVCRHWAVQLWNLWTDDLFTLRGEKITLGPDGSFELVVAAENPGAANWLDTGGREVGTVMFRWMEAAERVPRPNLEVFKL